MGRILLIGKNGQVGYELERSLQSLGDVIALDRLQLDLTDFKKIGTVIRGLSPDLIVNAAAYTAITSLPRQQISLDSRCLACLSSDQLQPSQDTDRPKVPLQDPGKHVSWPRAVFISIEDFGLYGIEADCRYRCRFTRMQ